MKSKAAIEYLRPAAAWLRTRPAALIGSTAYKEVLYQRVFQRDLERLGIEDDFYPFDNAANYALLYLLLRTTTALPVVNVVEFGSGQTSILLDRIADTLRNSPDGRDMHVRSYEHDEPWADRIGSMVSHPVVLAPLVSTQVAGRTCEFYDTEGNSDEGGFDLLLVDGPIGTLHHSRWGSLGYIEENVEGDFVIIFDDAARFGEAQTINECRRILERQAIPFYEARYRSNKEQHVFSSAGYAAAKFF